ncbi:MAG: glycosyltransferase [Ferruginibacter sp.]
MNKFSIILPVRNGGDYVKECVNSILAQTVADFDLLVLDNNSNDGTPQWLASLNDHRIKIFPSADSLTIEQNWARVVEVPKNEFITLIGHDDLLLPHYLDEMNKLIEKHPHASLYQSHFSFIDGKGNFKSNCKPMDEVQHAHEFLASQFTRTLDSTGTGYMMRSKDYDQLGGIPNYPNLIFADYQLWVQLTFKNYKATSAKQCFSYRIHDSVSKLTNGEHYRLAFERYLVFLAGIKKQNEDISSAIEKYGYDWIMYMCESLSHRLLKTPVALRKITVSDFIRNCKKHAAELLPGQKFEPSSKFRIWIAALLDKNVLGRKLFFLYKKMS